jgi:fanconi-associated nuclease 1
LRIPLREKHDFGHVRLATAVERDVFGTEIEREETPGTSRRNSTGEIRGAKTIWLDELDTNEHVSVESMCLSHYRKVLGWKGYHSEGGILRMLFGLLFSEVLFAYVPNVFQTAYQTCPLDLHTDTFYPARISEINVLINDISNGNAEDIIRQTWQQHYERRTCIVGVRWDDYELEDMIEIARCFPAEALGTVMRVMAQEYAARGGGVPDLFLWRPNGKSGEVMFVEVKSVNDRLSDTQRLWISVLLGAGIPVELCHALAKETDASIAPTSRKVSGDKFANA